MRGMTTAERVNKDIVVEILCKRNMRLRSDEGGTAGDICEECATSRGRREGNRKRRLKFD